MVNITLQEIQDDPLAYLRRVEAGETFLILRGDQPIAEMKPVAAAPRLPRPFGLAKGEFVVPDDFDAPLPDDVLREFEGG
jgi:antitoxin (DNA-binding transcriptional repressor) of toxin-antitoxin stability system